MKIQLIKLKYWWIANMTIPSPSAIGKYQVTEFESWLLAQPERPRYSLPRDSIVGSTVYYEKLYWIEKLKVLGKHEDFVNEIIS